MQTTYYYKLQILSLVIFQVLLICSNSLRLHYTDFSDIGNNIILQQSSKVARTTVRLLPEPNPASRSIAYGASGWMVYKDAIALLDSSQKARSFNTSFTFQIITPGKYGHCPNGMAFLVSAFSSAALSPTAGYNYLGLANSTTIKTDQFLAVEFDTYKSKDTNDPSSSHIGIDINSMDSVNFTDTSSASSQHYPDLYLYNNSTFTAWIAYQASSNIIKVWMTNKNSAYSQYLNPPNDDVLQSILQYRRDLSSVFSTASTAAENGLVYVGFSAATDDNGDTLGAVIKSWYFSMDDDTSNNGGISKRTKLILGISIPVGLSLLITISITIFKISFRDLICCQIHNHHHQTTVYSLQCFGSNNENQNTRRCWPWG